MLYTKDADGFRHSSRLLVISVMTAYRASQPHSSAAICHIEQPDRAAE